MRTNIGQLLHVAMAAQVVAPRHPSFRATGYCQFAIRKILPNPAGWGMNKFYIDRFFELTEECLTSCSEVICHERTSNG